MKNLFALIIVLLVASGANAQNSEINNPNCAIISQSYYSQRNGVINCDWYNRMIAGTSLYYKDIYPSSSEQSSLLQLAQNLGVYVNANSSFSFGGGVLWNGAIIQQVNQSNLTINYSGSVSYHAEGFYGYVNGHGPFDLCGGEEVAIHMYRQISGGEIDIYWSGNDTDMPNCNGPSQNKNFNGSASFPYSGFQQTELIKLETMGQIGELALKAQGYQGSWIGGSQAVYDYDQDVFRVVRKQSDQWIDVDGHILYGSDVNGGLTYTNNFVTLYAYNYEPFDIYVYQDQSAGFVKMNSSQITSYNLSVGSGTHVIVVASDGDVAYFTLNSSGPNFSQKAGASASEEMATKNRSVVDIGGEIPTAFTLEGNFPNPFAGATAFRYTLPQAQHVTVRVFDATGRAVATLVDAFQAASTYEVTFDGDGLPSGVYFYQVQAAGQSVVRTMTLVR